MNPLENISDVFATFHDGSLDEIHGNYDELWLKVGCTYLAELREKHFDCFYLKLHHVDEFYFNDYSGRIQRLDATTNLEQLGIELLYSGVESQRVKIDCTKGVLSLLCESIELFDQEKNPISTQELFDLAQLYWSKK